jgi:hypothetical protein
MRPSFRVLAFASFALAAAGCGPGIAVRTMAAPDASFSAFRTFRILSGPARRDGRVVSGDDDPMIGNSIANRAIRDRIVKAFQKRGYVQNERDADFAVAFYATAREKLDVNAWDYGYSSGSWPNHPRQLPLVLQYVEGTVVIDVVKPNTRELLWRGEGRAELTNDPGENVKQLAIAAEAIVASFPSVAPRVVAVRP